MRVTSAFYVSALTRRVFGSGGFAAVLRRGADEAGAVFVMARGRAGLVTLIGPAPQSLYEEGRPHERRFSALLTDAEGSEVEKRIAKEARFDPDIWVVEIEPGELPLAQLMDLFG